jgi:hypothetical protein
MIYLFRYVVNELSAIYRGIGVEQRHQTLFVSIAIEV